ncbi:MAG: GntR family transcriptional regulator [Clostridium sp.]|jgi:GntR family transcriptional regulator
MKLIVNHSSMVPIYEQIVEQIKTQIRDGSLQEGDVLPSVRALAGTLKISALTVKKAYDTLEAQGFSSTVHGKGSYITATNRQLIWEEQRKEVEEDLHQAVQKARRYGIQNEELRSLLDCILEDETC